MSRREHRVTPEVREADPTESTDVGVLTERVYRAGGWTDEGYARLLRDGRSRIEEATVFVATLGDAIVGTVTLALPATRFADVSRPDEAEVRMLAVREDARRRGVAHSLMDACERRSRIEGVAGVVLSTEPDMYAAHHLYRHRGYLRQPDRDWTVGRFRLIVYRKGFGKVASS